MRWRSGCGRRWASGRRGGGGRAVIQFSNSRHTFAFSRLVSPEFCFTPRPLERKGAEKAGCRLAPAVHCAERLHTQCTAAYSEAGNNPAFPAQWVDGLCRALLGDEFVFVTVASRIDDASKSGWLDAPPLGLAVATTARTTRFRRTQQHRSSRAVECSRGSAQSSARPALHLPRRRCPRPPQPDPRFVTTYDRPFRESGWGHSYVNSEFR
jgi:hypothetical protein